MRAIVAAGLCPFDHDDMETLALRLVQVLRRQGQEAELVRLDARFPHQARVADQAAALHALRCDRADRLITLGWPATLLRHNRKAVWLNQRSVAGGWLREVEREGMESLRQQERHALETAHCVFAMSEAASAAAKALYSLDFAVLRLPPSDAGAEAHDRSELPGDIVALRYLRDPRAHFGLALAGLAAARPSLSMLFVGAEPDNGLRKKLLGLARSAGVDGRVQLVDKMPASGVVAVLDLAEPGVSCGLWLQGAAGMRVPTLVATDSDAWEVACRHAGSMQLRPSAQAVADALNALPPSPLMQSSTAPSDGDGEAGWDDVVASLIG